MNVDFRGRIYPIPPHLNHIGPDYTRGLFLFSNKKPLTKSGLKWLKIHLSNQMGFDKASFEDRVSYVESRLDEIFKWVDNPLKNDSWMQIEDKWQCLASAWELTMALRSDFPEDF